MAQKSKTFKEIISAYASVVTYVPLRGEVDFRTLLKTPCAGAYEIAPRASLDPFAEAQKAAKEVGSQSTCILLPGRSFDALGTRQGQGGGWYDRFLSQAPPSWVRIGLCTHERFATHKLPRLPWDEPVDYVVVVNGTARTYRLLETNARKNIVP